MVILSFLLHFPCNDSPHSSVLSCTGRAHGSILGWQRCACREAVCAFSAAQQCGSSEQLKCTLRITKVHVQSFIPQDFQSRFPSGRAKRSAAILTCSHWSRWKLLLQHRIPLFTIFCHDVTFWQHLCLCQECVHWVIRTESATFCTPSFSDELTLYTYYHHVSTGIANAS